MDLLREGLAPFVEREVQTAVKAGSVRVDAIRRFAEDPKLASSGPSERIVRVVTENARTLKFSNQGFESE